MSYYLLVRGPLGVGKTTVSKATAKELGAAYFSVDGMLEERRLWHSGRLSEFLNANKLLAKAAGRVLKRGSPAVLDGNFYWKTQIRDLEQRLDFPHVVFTLRAPLRLCVARDADRASPHGIEAAREVYAKATRFRYGTEVDATQPLAHIVNDIVTQASRLTAASLPRHVSAERLARIERG
jgi:predicted kinase